MNTFILLMSMYFSLLAVIYFFRKQLSNPIINKNCKEFLLGMDKTMLLNIITQIVLPSILFATIEYIPKVILRGDLIRLDDYLWETIGGRTYWFTSALVVAQLILLTMLITRYRKIWLYWIVSLEVLAYGMFMAHHNMIFMGLPCDL